MQNPNISLDEIIWEIVQKCENHCTYCGSKDGWNEEIDSEKIIKIAQAISEYPPKAVNISGGDPLLVSVDVHKKIVQLFKSKNIQCKIIVNPKSFLKNTDRNLAIVNLYDRVGISVNSKSDAEDYPYLYDGGITAPITIITNFNLGNIFHYDYIENRVRLMGDSVSDNGCPWMVQYTMYRGWNEMALYEPENEISLLNLVSRIQKSINNGTQVVLSDNLGCGACSAGHHSLGIFSCGSVVGCLSMRSWIDQKEIKPEGNILTHSLKTIWEHGFLDFRFGKFSCCKDVCHNKQIFFTQEETDGSGSLEGNTSPNEFQENLLRRLREESAIPIRGGGIRNPPDDGMSTPFVYGVAQPTTMIVYGVWPSTTTGNLPFRWQSGTISISGTNDNEGDE